MKATIKLASPVVSTPRVLQMAGMFDLPASERSEVVLEADLPIEEKPWAIGLIVGPSGCGKSSVARHFWPKEIAPGAGGARRRAAIAALAGKGLIEIVADGPAAISVARPVVNQTNKESRQ